ncbi:zinc-binding dehydrogenase [Chloroflexota bacterium]
MAKTMKAWRLHGYGDRRFDEIPIPEVKPGWVLVKVKVVQASIGELGGRSEGMPHPSKAIEDKMLAEGKPITHGHEFCGEVVEVGQGVTRFKVGDRVGYRPVSVPCGECSMCLAGKKSQCLSPLEIPGAFAEYVCMPEDAGLIKAPDGPTDNEVAAFQPIASGVGQVRPADIQMGDSVVVLGQGAMGMGVLQLAKLAGAGLLIAVDVRPEVLDISRQYGANIVINSREVDPVQEVMRATGGAGADIVFEAAGGRAKDGLAGFQTVQQALQMVRKEGKVVQVANLEGSMEIDPSFMKRRGITYLFPGGFTAEDLEYVAFLVASGRVKVAPQLSHVLYGFDKFPEAAEISLNKAKHRATNSAQIVL